MQPFKGGSCGLVRAEFLWKMEHKGGALVGKKHNIQRLKYKYHRAQLFEGRIGLNLGLNLTQVSFSCVQKHFLG